MREVITQDQSKTFYNEDYGETYHSTSGAVEEAFKKYAGASNIDFLAKKEAVTILDVCFGLGYNSAAAVDMIWSINPACKIKIVGLEKDTEILQKIIGLTPKIKNYDVIKNAIRHNYSYADEKINIDIIIGDARDTIQNINITCDLIFHDPFSPKKNPELWTEEFFKEEKRILKPQGTLTTYSCARAVRDNLKKAGFFVLDGPCVGRRSPSTVAKPNHF